MYMKRLRKALLVFVIVIAVTGLCGCMNKENEEVTAENLKRYATDKYGKDFAVENFQAAKDETYTNILTLSDGEYLFNVYQSAGSEVSDDYPQVIVNQKIRDLLLSKCGSAFEIYGNFILSDGNNMTLDYAIENDVSAVLKDHALVKAVVVIKTDKELAALQEELYRIYRETLELSPKYIDFEVIKVGSASTDLKDMLLNLPAFYDGTWSKYPEIESYVSITETDILSASELLKDVIHLRSSTNEILPIT